MVPRSGALEDFGKDLNLDYIWDKRGPVMKLSEAVKPISYLKAHAAEIVRDISSGRKTYIITQNGEAKAVFQDVAQYERTQETLALLKMIALSGKSLNEGRVKPLGKAFKDIRKRIKDAR